MLSYVLDASAVMRFLDGEGGVQETKQILQNADDGLAIALMSAVNWGEVIYGLIRRHGLVMAQQIERRLSSHALQIVSATDSRSARAGILKPRYGISYADAFGVELASDSAEHILVTADFGVKPAQGDIQIEFLPTKQKP